MEQQDALVVIKQSDLDKLTKSAGVTYPTFHAWEVFEAAREDVITNWLNTEGNNIDRKYNDYTDYEKTKI